MAEHFRRMTGNWEFDLSEHHSGKRRMGQCGAGASGFEKCKEVMGECGKCKVKI